MGTDETTAAVTDEQIDAIIGHFLHPDIDLFRVLLDETARAGAGDLAELGVLYGRSAVLIGASTQEAEVFTVVDLFESAASDAANQSENADSYPGLSRRAFEAAYGTVLPDLPVVIQGLSHTIADHARHGTHRFIHVDASHLHEHVARDIEVSRTLLREQGVIVLDDIREEHTPGVAAAAWQAVVTTDLRPFAISPHKLYATFGEPAPFHEAVLAWADRTGQPHEVQVVNDLPLARLWHRRGVVPPSHPARRFVPPVAWPALRRVAVRLGRAEPESG